MYKRFQFSSEISKSSFYKYAKSSGEFKKPFRITDICDYCEHFNYLKIQIDKSLKELNYTNKDIFDIKNAQEFLEEKKRLFVPNSTISTEFHREKIKTLSKQINDYETILFHKNIASFQREAYNRHRSDALQLENKILIEVDFKQRITIGLSPRQVNSEYYNQITRSCLGN